MKKILIFIGLVVLIASCSSGIPDDVKDKRLYHVNKNGEWIMIKSDNTFVLHLMAPDVKVDSYGNLAGISKVWFEWTGKIDGLKLIPNKPLEYRTPSGKLTKIDSDLIYVEGDDRVGWKPTIQITFDNQKHSSNFE